jgi:RNA polymerase sigma factor (sigma-70 family)
MTVRASLSETADADARTQAALESLSGRYRKILVLHDVEGLAMEEIAGRLGVSRAVAERRWMRAIVALSERLGEVERGSGG